ncbi:MAG: DUF6644 family protein [Candidatus Acidiferrales bacterium]|jgi:hypothetical protein
MEHLSWVQYVGMTAWLYSSIAVVHYFTLLVLVGTSVLVDLRVLDLAATSRPVAEVSEQIYPWMWGSFWLAIFSGFLMFTTDAGDYLPDTVFRVKMTAILLAVISTILVQRGVPQWGQRPSMPVGAKVLASISLLLWIGSILAGVEIAAISGLG